MEAGRVKFEYEPSIALNMDYDSSITIVRMIKYMLSMILCYGIKLKEYQSCLY